MGEFGRAPSGQALAVPATPASAVDGPSGFDPSRLLGLAERCEQATGPDHPGLDTDIHEAVGNCVHRETEYYQVQSDTGFTCKACRKDTYGFAIPKYTASLDAAMTLVPESDDSRAVFWRLGNDGEGGNPGDFKAEVLIASTFAAKQFVGLADTAALALCAAALRARASQDTPSPQEDM
jgi:hypothetical protein